jgi:RimJ/RimL family protein N-acetyltransferase
VTPLNPPLLEGRHAHLEPLQMGHAEALLEAAADGALWESRVTIVPGNAAAMDDYLSEALAGQAEGRYLCFVVIRASDGRVVGSTRYRAIALAHRRLEIGSTWLSRSAQRTAINTECKRLLLAHAFEVLGCERVELVTDVLNTQSRAAILRLGAVEEGILRRHMVMPDGRIRDSVMHSIIAAEWPAVRARLDARLALGTGG